MLRLLPALLLFPLLLPAQSGRIEELLALKPDIVGELGTQNLPRNMRLLHMDFAGSRFTNPVEFKNLKADSIVGIKLVYTRFKELESFDQPALNRSRLEMLNRQFPGILNRKDIRWEILEQRNAITRENAVRCFHGFVLVMARPAPPAAGSRTEISSVERILRTVRDTSYDIPLTIDYRIKKVRVPTGKYLPRSEKKRRNGFRYDKPGIWFRQAEMKTRRDSIEKKRSGGYTIHKRIFDAGLLPDTNVLDILNRQKDLKKKVVVQDVTGSMAPYTTQVLLWIMLRPDLLESGKFLFFNDGDNMPDEWKVIGKTGGLYPLRTDHFDTLKEMVFRAMRNGTGGDIPENNVEAVLRAIEVFPEADSVLMIADNMAPVKDMKLLGRVSKPVNVVFCNIGNNINPNLIDIAIKTGGYLLFEEGQVFDPRKARDGSKIYIGRKTFEYRRSRFTLVHVKPADAGIR